MLSFGTLATKVFGSSNERKLKKYASAVETINALEPETAALTDEQLRARTDEFRKRLADPAPLGLSASGEEGTRQMMALCGLGNLRTNVNLPNVGQIDNLPRGAVVETNARHDAEALGLDEDLAVLALVAADLVAEEVVGAEKPVAVPTVLENRCLHAGGMLAGRRSLVGEAHVLREVGVIRRRVD